MKHILNSVIVVIAIVFTSCSTPKFYKEIQSTYPQEERDDIKLNISFKPHKLILKELQQKFDNTNHIIFHYSPSSDWTSVVFSGFIYDVDNNLYYFVSNNDTLPKNIEVENVKYFEEFDYYMFVINNYRNGKIGYLQELGKLSNHSGYRTKEVIYDIDLTKKKYKRYVFDDFLFMNGKPNIDVQQ